MDTTHRGLVWGNPTVISPCRAGVILIRTGAEIRAICRSVPNLGFADDGGDELFCQRRPTGGEKAAFVDPVFRLRGAAPVDVDVALVLRRERKRLHIVPDSVQRGALRQGGGVDLLRVLVKPAQQLNGLAIGVERRGEGGDGQRELLGQIGHHVDGGGLVSLVAGHEGDGEIGVFLTGVARHVAGNCLIAVVAVLHSSGQRAGSDGARRRVLDLALTGAGQGPLGLAVVRVGVMPALADHLGDCDFLLDGAGLVAGFGSRFGDCGGLALFAALHRNRLLILHFDFDGDGLLDFLFPGDFHFRAVARGRELAGHRLCGVAAIVMDVRGTVAAVNRRAAVVTDVGGVAAVGLELTGSFGIGGGAVAGVVIPVVGKSGLTVLVRIHHVHAQNAHGEHSKQQADGEKQRERSFQCGCSHNPSPHFSSLYSESESVGSEFVLSINLMSSSTLRKGFVWFVSIKVTVPCHVAF